VHQSCVTNNNIPSHVRHDSGSPACNTWRSDLPARDAVERPAEVTTARTVRVKPRILTVSDVDVWNSMGKILDSANSGSKRINVWSELRRQTLV